jgi:hypothetical protein
VAVQHVPEEIDPSPSQSSQKGEGPLSRLHFGSLNTIPFQPKIQPCQRYLTFLMSGNPIPFCLFCIKSSQPDIYIFKPGAFLPTFFEKRRLSPPKMTSPYLVLF